jgi:malonyl-CoA O-methyltransferase
MPSGVKPALYPQDDMTAKQGIRRNFARRAQSYDRHACIQRLMGQGLMALVHAPVTRARRMLEIGCGTGYLTHLLRQVNHAARLVALDLDASLVAAARQRLGPEARVEWLVADGEATIRGEYDLIIANATFQWFTRPEATLSTYYRRLTPGGILAFSTLGPKTFQELAGALTRAGLNLRLSKPPKIAAQDFSDREVWHGRLNQAGFQQVQLAREVVTTTFPSVPEFLKAIRATGATNPRPTPFSPRVLSAMISLYQDLYGKNGSIPVSYEIIWAVARQ